PRRARCSRHVARARAARAGLARARSGAPGARWAGGCAMSELAAAHTLLRVTRARLDTYQQPVVYMHRDCEVCRSEGLAAMTRVRLDVGSRTLVATLNVVVDDRIGLDEVALSETAWTLLDPMPDVLARVRHAE